MLRNSYQALFNEVNELKDRETIVLPPLEWMYFAYPHREGA